MKRSFKALTRASLFALAFAAAPAMAEVVLNSDGTGFVGKGDVQLAFGWNNAQLQANASALTFSYENLTVFSYTCTWLNGNETKTQTRTKRETIGIESDVTFDARRVNQVSGFILEGFDESFTESGDIPAVGDECPGYKGTGATVTAVEQQGENIGGLFVTHADVSKQLL
jgi:hypothetical protein